MEPIKHANALVLLNPAAGGGRGLQRWAAVEPIVTDTFQTRLVETDAAGQWEEAVQEAASGGTRLFIAAGGDGTVRALTEALVRAADHKGLHRFTLGAAGLGSSNDFHKPVGRTVEGIPLRIGPGRVLRDIGRASFSPATPGDRNREKYFIVSASMGLVAEANAFFSGDNTVQKWLRSRRTQPAILHAALRTLVSYRNRTVRLRFPDRREETVSLTNLSVTKSQWLSGAFRYDTTVEAADGLLAVHLCEEMNRPEAFRVMLDLARGRFQGRPGRHSWRIPCLEVELRQPATLELDGELYTTNHVSFELLPERIGICT